MSIINQKGQGLVETLIAISVAIIVIAALISLAVFALRNSKQASYVARATQIAQQQLEYFRAYRDSNTWTTVSGMTSTCYNSSVGTSVVPVCGGTDNSNKCKITYTSGTGYANSTSVGTDDVFTYYYHAYCSSNPPTACNASGGVVRVGVMVTWNVGGKQECVYNYGDFTNWRVR